MRLPVFSWLFLMAIYSLFLSIRVFGVSGQCIGNQQSLLLQLKNNLTFDPAMSKKLVKWNQSVDCCSWEGVTCREGRVTGLDLASESISGGLDNSSSLFNLQHLQSLSLAYNDFNYSQIPSEFDKLVNLRYLNLSFADFAGQIPTAISRLKRLVTLDLSIYYDCSFLKTPCLTLENPNLNMLVQNLSELIELYLDGVPISAQGKEWCQVLSSSLPNLRVLSLSYCNLSGPIDSSLRNLQSLSIIRLNGNKFSAPVPEFFADFKNLTSLEVSSSGLNGKFPEKIFQVPTLQILDLRHNHDLQGSLPEFPPNGSLRTMLLGITGFFGILPPSIGNLKMLSMIALHFCNFSGSIPSSMARLTQLVYLDMSSNNFNGSIPSSMARLTELVYLDMSYNNFNGSIPIFSMTKNMEILDLTGNSLSGQIPICLFSLPSLRELLLSNNKFSGQINNKFSNISSHLLETLDLSSNNLEGPICLFFLPSLRELQLPNNQFSGQINKCSNISSHLLETLDLSSNNLEGPIPIFLLELQGLFSLSLSSNHFNSSLQLGVIQQLKNLRDLDLSHNKLKTIPDFLRNQTSLQILSLSNNQIYGEIPNWLLKLPALEHIDLSYNFLATLEGPIFNLSLSSLNLRSNQLQGQLPIISSVDSLDLSRNNFHSSIPASISWSLASTTSFSLSSNKLYGSIPSSICNSTNLRYLDLSNNSFSGTIPECLIAGSFWVLDLSTNNLNGTIPNTFQHWCCLQFLALNGNQLGGELPKYLANCTGLGLLDVGHNRIEDTFPFYLKNASYLEVLVLRSNKFYGPIAHLNPNATWPLLQIVDIALNNFTGRLPIIPQSNWTAMMDQEDEAQFMFREIIGSISYQGTVTITIKGSPLEIQTPHTTLDFSCNNFDGPIPEEIGELTSLYILNLSHNALTGQIQPSLGKLRNLESLDLSSNELSGKIPVQLADGLIFLSVLNLSFNQLVGQIPFIKQFATFPETSFKGNKRLCGLPLKSKCTYEKPRLSPPTYEESHSNSRILIEWNYISAELGFIFGFGIVIGPLMFWKRWRIWYYKHVDDILFQLYLGNEYRRR